MSRIAIIMGSSSDWDTLQHAAQTLEDFKMPNEVRVISAHRTPELMFDFARTAPSEKLLSHSAFHDWRAKETFYARASGFSGRGELPFRWSFKAFHSVLSISFLVSVKPSSTAARRTKSSDGV